MDKNVVKNVVAFITGVAMSIGISLTGMLSIKRSQDFYSFPSNFWQWDLSLMFALGAALIPNVLVFQMRGSKPLLEDKFLLPTATEVTFQLVSGSLLFGLGWAISGFCPGPNVILSVFSSRSGIYSAMGMITGWIFYKNYMDYKAHKKLDINFLYILPAFLLLGLALLFPDVSLSAHENTRSYLRSTIGGLLIAAAAASYLLLLGRVLGLSGIFSSMISPVTDNRLLKSDHFYSYLFHLFYTSKTFKKKLE